MGTALPQGGDLWGGTAKGGGTWGLLHPLPSSAGSPCIPCPAWGSAGAGQGRPQAGGALGMGVSEQRRLLWVLGSPGRGEPSPSAHPITALLHQKPSPHFHHHHQLPGAVCKQPRPFQHIHLHTGGTNPPEPPSPSLIRDTPGQPPALASACPGFFPMPNGAFMSPQEPSPNKSVSGL